MKTKIILIVVAVVVAIQFIRLEPNNGAAETPRDIAHVVQVPGNVMQVLKTSCYDCHSNRTTYPWYSRINPVGWWLDHHIKEGKAELNFSEFAAYDKKRQDHKLEETAEEVQEGHMPLPSYLYAHADAKLSPAQVQLIVDWVKTERGRLAVSAK